MQVFEVSTPSRRAFVDITPQVERIVRESKVEEGAVLVYVPHTTCGITINENADPSVKTDLDAKLAELVPEHDRYRHLEGNSDAHIKASLVGSSCMVPISGGRLALGTWQGILLCEFDGPRRRRVYVQVLSTAQ